MSTSAGRWATAVSIIATLVAGAQPARAADDGNTVAWTMAPCVTVGEMWQYPLGNWQYNLLEGSVAQCDPVVDSGGFRIATYRPDSETGSAPGHNVRLFASAEPGQVRHFVAAALPVDEGVYGVCILAGANERFGCLRVEVSEGETTFIDVISPLATDDPLVDKDVTTTPFTGSFNPPRPGEVGPKPACGTCF